MKNLIFLFFLLAGYSAQAQYDARRFGQDTLTRPIYSQIASRPGNLSDTLDKTPYRIDFEKSYKESPREDGGVELFFDTSRDRKATISREFYTFPVLLHQPIDDKVRFEIDWSVFFARPCNTGCSEVYDGHSIFILPDTVVTFTSPADAGGISPEGQVFRFRGENIRNIDVRTKYIFSVFQGIALNGMDDWRVFLENIESPWMECGLDAFSYRLPLIDTLIVSGEQFRHIKQRAVAVQREYLTDKRDSILHAADAWGTPKFRKQALAKLRARLKPHFEDATNFEELYLSLELKYFVTEIRLKMNDGQVRNYVHIAAYDANIP
ncbi:MAG: hypothetical protein RSC12_00830 [Alistipes sp.]